MPRPASGTRNTELRNRLSALRMPASDAPTFAIDEAPDEPFELFTEWFLRAIDGNVAAPHAMTLATATPDDGPSARTVLLRDVAGRSDTETGWFAFASTSDSPKGGDLEHEPRAALVFHWREQHRQIRITGLVTPAPREVSERDFLARPAASRAGIVAGRQSDPLPEADTRERLQAGARELLAVNPQFVPPSWTVYRLVPRAIEFWQGQPGTAQQRLRYRIDAETWLREPLWP